MKPAVIKTLLIFLIFYGCNPREGITNADSWQASAEVIERHSLQDPSVNYHESRVAEYILPDLLTDDQGRKIKSEKEWSAKRRGEILELFRENVYGRVPETAYKESFRIITRDDSVMDRAATLKQVEIIIKSGGDSLHINLTVFVPNGTDKPVPVFLLINNRGIENIDPSRTVKSEFWPAEEVVARGYAIAAFTNADVDPDFFDGFKNGIHGLLDRKNRIDDSWGTIAAWAWGASRCMDYLESDSAIDSKKVALVGHSRGGKTALWAGAEDERFSIIINNESGCGGAALARRKYGETVERITNAFPHWFCSNYCKYADNEDDMPVDMHMLLALTAPRSLYVACASDDLWGDPKGSYLALYNSMPVFRLLKTGSDISGSLPPINTQVISGKTGFHIRDGAHNMLLKDWQWFMDFADRQWERE